MKPFLKYTFTSSFLFSCLFHVLGQIQTGEYPPSFFSKSAKLAGQSNTFTVQIEKPNLEQIRKEDQIEDQHKDIPWRFGKAIDVDYNLTNSGVWIQEGSVSIWKLTIKVPDAISLNLNFDQFELSENAKLFAFTNNYNDVLGALTSRNNKTDGKFAIRPLKGDELTLELTVPTQEVSQNIITISQVVYGYRNIFEKASKSFGSSGNCNLDINCEKGERWNDIKRSVVLILRANNTRWCSGALVNNVLEDGKPFVLTANHCGLQTNSIFVFNYESPNCKNPTDGSLSNSISGATLRASHGNSDFTLFELSSTPPASFHVYYAGWDNRDISSQRSTGIHHPSGDVKKISHDYDSVTNSGYYSSGTTHWQVSNWDEGTTEVGSSGSSLFNQYQRIVGQLHGGDASCTDNLQDYYGKFSTSWNAISGNSNQLQPWLDPNNTGTQVMNGFDPASANHAYDIELIHLYHLSNYSCDTAQVPKLILKNKGDSSVQYIKMQVVLNGMFQSPLVFNGNLNRHDIVEIAIPNLQYGNGINQLSIYVDSIGPNPDQYYFNDTLEQEFYVNKVNDFVNVALKTDDYGSETSWLIKPNNHNFFSIKSPLYQDVNGGVLYNQSVCLYDSCFTFELNDAFNDGFNGTFGNGYLLVTNSIGDTLIFENNFTTGQKTYSFCLSGVSSIQENKRLEKLELFPNPVQSGNQLLVKGKIERDVTLIIFDLNGREVLKPTLNGQIIDIPSSLNAGIYFLKIVDDTKRYAPTKFIVQ